jgi:hypothetical protein
MMSELSSAREYNLRYCQKLDDTLIGRMLRGSIDTHLHFAPAPFVAWRCNALETAIAARDAGLRAIVLKNHSYTTTPLANLVSELVPGVEVFGGICLEYECGGLNSHAVEAEAKLGGKIVWMPVFSSKNSRAIVNCHMGLNLRDEGISILDTNGKLLPEVDEILKIIQEYDMALATGHISSREIVTLVDRAKQLNVTKIVVTHAMNDFISETILSLEERQMLAKEGVLMEHTAVEIMPTAMGVDPADVAASIKKEGPRNCIMATDLGRIPHVTVGEGMRMFISTMLKHGLNEEEINYMVKKNPSRLLGLKLEE